MIDPSLVHKVPDDKYRVYRLPIIELTKTEMKKMVYTSAVSLGAMAYLTDVLKPESIQKALLKKAPRGTEEPNKIAFQVGYNAAKELV